MNRYKVFSNKTSLGLEEEITTFINSNELVSLGSLEIVNGHFFQSLVYLGTIPKVDPIPAIQSDKKPVKEPPKDTKEEESKKPTTRKKRTTTKKTTKK